MPAFLGLIIAAVICHFFFYMPPAMLGMRTGLPLYVVGTSTYGARGGLLMPGFLMGLLQFGWLAVNACIRRRGPLQVFRCRLSSHGPTVVQLACTGSSRRRSPSWRRSSA